MRVIGQSYTLTIAAAPTASERLITMNTVTLTDDQNDSIVATLFVAQAKIERMIGETEQIIKLLMGNGVTANDTQPGSALLTYGLKRSRLLRRRTDLTELVRIFTTE